MKMQRKYSLAGKDGGVIRRVPIQNITYMFPRNSKNITVCQKCYIYDPVFECLMTLVTEKLAEHKDDKGNLAGATIQEINNECDYMERLAAKKINEMRSEEIGLDTGLRRYDGRGEMDSRLRGNDGPEDTDQDLAWAGNSL